jgi:hypothetical protein
MNMPDESAKEWAGRNKSFLMDAQMTWLRGNAGHSALCPYRLIYIYNPVLRNYKAHRSIQREFATDPKKPGQRPLSPIVAQLLSAVLRFLH